MKVLPFKIPKTEKESFRVQIDDAPYLYDTLHKHAEIQITFLVKGEGTLLCGDFVGNFGEGDLFVIGPNQPHVFRNNKDHYEETSDKSAHAISLFFNKRSFGKEFFLHPNILNFNSTNRTTYYYEKVFTIDFNFLLSIFACFLSSTLFF